nr:hypothetical protein [Tanacetum cinerariifolium]
MKRNDDGSNELDYVNRIWYCLIGMIIFMRWFMMRSEWFDIGVGEFTLSSLDMLQGFSFFLQMGLTLILATLDGLDVRLLGDVIGEDDCDDDG